jgi:hypothetical protein
LCYDAANSKAVYCGIGDWEIGMLYLNCPGERTAMKHNVSPNLFIITISVCRPPMPPENRQMNLPGFIWREGDRNGR